MGNSEEGSMHGYGMGGWSTGWMWMFGVVAIVALVLIFRPRM
jgi:hypothetical protein